ncbi:MAG: cell division protein ZapB [Desulfatibacillaceae bacterium]|nr:cell division protein ZapB [Desulfatibacillaceae bacterium]
MDEAGILQDFDRLEARIDQLVRTCEALKAEKAALLDRVGELEALLTQKDEAQALLEHERAQVRSKVEGLLARLNGPQDEEV